MEPNEIMENDEAIETATEEIVKASSGCGFKVAAGFGLGILAGMAICKLARPVIAKIRARKEAPVIDVPADGFDGSPIDVEEEVSEK